MFQKQTNQPTSTRTWRRWRRGMKFIEKWNTEQSQLTCERCLRFYYYHHQASWMKPFEAKNVSDFLAYAYVCLCFFLSLPFHSLVFFSFLFLVYCHTKYNCEWGMYVWYQPAKQTKHIRKQNKNTHTQKNGLK